MGQRAMLILVLCIVVVGEGVVLGARALGVGKYPKNLDIVFRDALSIVADIQVWKLKPPEVDGGLRVDGFEGISFRSLHYSHRLFSKRVHRTEYGCYQLETIGERHHAVLTISAPTCAEKDYIAHVIVRGLGPGDLDWQRLPPMP